MSAPQFKTGGELDLVKPGQNLNAASTSPSGREKDAGRAADPHREKWVWKAEFFFFFDYWGSYRYLVGAADADNAWLTFVPARKHGQ